MPKLAGDHVQALVDGYEITGDSNRISIDDSRDLLDITAFGDQARNFRPGQRRMALRHAGFMNSGDARSHPVLHGADLAGIFSLYLGINTAPKPGDPVYSLPALQGGYSALAQVNRMIPFQAVFANRGDRGGWGIALASPRLLNGDASGMAVDNLAATHEGGWACLHVLAAADSDIYSFAIQGSSSGAFTGEESALAAFSLDGTALGSQMVKIDGTIPRYARWKATRSGAAGDKVKIAISLIRN